MTRANYQTGALRALKYLADSSMSNNVPLRTKIEHVIEYYELVELKDFADAIDYAMHYLAIAARQVPTAFVPSMTSVADLIEVDRTYTIGSICRQAIELMTCDMPPSILDHQLAAQALRGIAHTITTTPGDTILNLLNSATFGALIRKELKQPGYHDADHPNCIRRAICARLTKAADQEVNLENFPLDVVPLTSLVGLFNRAANMVDPIWP